MKTEQLMFDFNKKLQNFNVVKNDLIDSFCEVISSNDVKQTMKNTSVKLVKAESEDLRDRLNVIVKRHARHKNLHWKEVWRIMYERLRSETGFDPWVRGISKGITPLEAVIAHGKLEKLMAIGAKL